MQVLTDISTLKWKAVHSNKVVDSPNYADISRGTLESISLIKNKVFGKDETLITIKRPEGLEGKWLISWRMRTQITNGVVTKRSYLFEDRTEGIITRYNEDGTVERSIGWDDMPDAKPMTPSKIDET